MGWISVILIPLAVVYQLILNIRHKLYDFGLLRSRSFDHPVICVGNISFGGTGKTPHVEYLTRLLSSKYKIAILSRGYKRKTKGFVMGQASSRVKDIGDEPLQYVKKFEDVYVAVDENRPDGVTKLLSVNPKPDVVLLDDAFQHRKIDAGLKIMLTDYHNLFPNDYLFPAGNLRDTSMSAKRADIIVVTKTPKVFSPFTRRRLTDIIQPDVSQKLYFSYLQYGNFIPITGSKKVTVPKYINHILMFCGIANPYPLQEHLYTMCNNLEIMTFGDHHSYTKKDIFSILKRYEDIFGKNKILVTTEKDAMRLIDSPYFSQFENLPLFYVPITVKFHEEKGRSFDNQVLAYVRKAQGNN